MNKANSRDGFVDSEAYNGLKSMDTVVSKNYDAPSLEEASSFLLRISFVFISFGYMLPWTALGSLISYYKHTYSAHFYVKIYCAYYLPGLPVALMQYRYDEWLDMTYGSKNTYMMRGVLSFSSSALILFSLLWLESESQLVLLFTLLGISSWMCHGTASMIASMYPKSVIAYLQIGFRCPELYILLAFQVLDLGKDASEANLERFYKSTAIIVLFGLICWILVTGSSTSVKYFNDKDMQRRSDHQEGIPLIAKDNYSNKPAPSRAELRRSGGEARSAAASTSTVGRITGLLGSLTSPSQDENNDILPLCGALIVTIWGSIFQAAFFAYVESPRGRDIEQFLYFTRLVMDLLGRPLTFLPRPSFLQTNNQLLVAALVRASSLVIFFVYTFAPISYQNDYFIGFFVAVFSLLSGYFTVLIYEYAAKGQSTTAARAHSAVILNVSFQFAAFMAVSMSVAISSTGWLPQSR